MRADNHKEKKKIKASDNAIEERDGMRMGYHSEKGITDDDEKGDGMRMGYHSEKVNPGKHSKRLHKKQE